MHLKDFNYSIQNKQLQTHQLTLIDNKGNRYVTKESIIDLNNPKIASKDIVLYFNDKGQLGENARLKGSSLLSENKKTIINNGIFTTCKKMKSVHLGA